MHKTRSEIELGLARIMLKRLFSLKTIKIILVILLVLTLAPLVYFFFHRPQPVKNIRYGVTFSNRYATEIGLDWKDAYLKMLDDLNVKNVRLIAYWDEIEQTKGTYDFSNISWQLEEAQKRNINVMMAIGRKVPRYPECFEPKWEKALTTDAEKDSALYKYVSTATLRLKNYKVIKMWEVENEPFFPFGECRATKSTTLENEVTIVKNLDSRPILIQDSGEGGFWFPSYKLGDYLGISMYRKIWYNFWGIFLGKFIYFQYPLANWSYKIKADLLGVPYQRIIVTELQGEPWGPVINSKLSTEERDKTMSHQDFIATTSYAQSTGFRDLYYWGVEWWLWQKEVAGDPFYWDTAKALFKE